MELLGWIPGAKTEVQSLWFHKSKWSMASALNWLKSKGYKPLTEEETRNYYVFRIKEPVGYLEFRRIWFSPKEKRGILATIGIKRVEPLPETLSDFFGEFEVHEEVAENPKIQFRHLAVATVLTILIGVLIWKNQKKQKE